MNKLFKLLTEHLWPSLIIGIIVGSVSGSWPAFFCALALGWLIDLDHLLDLYLARSKFPKNHSFLDLVRTGAYFRENGKIYVILHSWELALAWGIGMCALGYCSAGIAGGFALIVHLIIDTFSYSIYWHSYSLIYRINKNFETSLLCASKK